MRVLLTSMAWASHYRQMVGMVWALLAAGHDVRVAGQPNIVDAVTETGVMAVPVGGDYDVMSGVAEMIEARKQMDQQPHLVGEGIFTEEARRQLLQIRMIPHIRLAEDLAEDLVEFARVWKPDLVITDPFLYAAPLAAAAAEAPLVRHLWGPDLSRHIGLPGNGLDPEEDPRAQWPKELVDLYHSYGARPEDDLAVLTLDNCPPSLQVSGVPNRVPIRFTAYNGATTVPSWLLGTPERPRVCVTWGSSTTQLVDDAFAVPDILEALDDFDVEVIVALSPENRARLPQVASGVRIVENLPLNLILPSCEAIIHGSGGGTALTAAAYGCPQVVLPHVGGEGIISDQLSKVGAGISLLPDESTPAAIREAVATALDGHETATAARTLQEELISQPPPSEAVASLEALVERSP